MYSLKYVTAKFMAPTVMEKDGKTFRAGEEIPEGARPAIDVYGKEGF